MAFNSKALPSPIINLTKLLYILISRAHALVMEACRHYAPGMSHAGGPPAARGRIYYPPVPLAADLLPFDIVTIT